MELENRARKIISMLKKEYPAARTALNYSTPVQMLVSTILSAQTTDSRVNQVTEKLFKKYRSVEDFAGADLKEFEQEIRSTGFYHNKARNIISSAGLIMSRFAGKVPSTMEDLLTLPGVARKTANIVLGNSYGIVEGIAVDTHVRRVSCRLGLTRNTDPEKIEKDLMGLLPVKDWFASSNLIISHGRKICQAKKPDCPQCVINKLCPKVGVKSN